MEPTSRTPLWLEFSGLPAEMNEAARTPAGWLFFLRLVALDCRLNPDAPGLVSISLEEFGRGCGLEPAQARQIAERLRKRGWIACFLPDNDEEEALFRVRAPLAAPVPAEEVRRAHPALFGHLPPGAPLRYERAAGESLEAEEPAEDPILQEVVDLYLNHVSMKINGMILDQLRLARSRYSLEEIRRVCARAKKKGISSVHWLLSELSRSRSRKRKKAASSGESA
jgi:hypothetical protein